MRHEGVGVGGVDGGEVGGLRSTRDIGIAGPVYGDGNIIFPEIAAQIGGIENLCATDIELGDEGILPTQGGIQGIDDGEVQ